MNRFILDFEKPIQELQAKIDELEMLARSGQIGIDGELKRLRAKAGKLREEIYSRLTRWQCVQLARHPHRPYALDYIKAIVQDFVELQGDRRFRDDPSIVAGFGRWDGRSAAIIGHQKGRGTRDNLLRNFGMPHPEGYRKALRVMKTAARFGLPVVTLIDTPGAYPGLGAEERGQAQAIAENLYEMAQLERPIVAVVIGEGGSGGALALGVADRVLMLQYSIYSVISPEGCASILYRDASKAQLAAEALKLTSSDLLENGLIDSVIPEPLGGAHNDPAATASSVAEAVSTALGELEPLPSAELIDRRIEKFRRMGRWIEE
ncbi:MAG: acetyl-CoA carboxylase carboxyltransferase subunit alpha [Calditrichaeota bacterium]|nr:acetyl-CoA carboxylase carboxyltransferase subunit alpha [Calditrichota bacterium]